MKFFHLSFHYEFFHKSAFLSRFHNSLWCYWLDSFLVYVSFYIVKFSHVVWDQYLHCWCYKHPLFTMTVFDHKENKYKKNIRWSSFLKINKLWQVLVIFLYSFQNEFIFRLSIFWEIHMFYKKYKWKKRKKKFNKFFINLLWQRVATMQVYAYKFYKTFMNNFFTEDLRKTASIIMIKKFMKVA